MTATIREPIINSFHVIHRGNRTTDNLPTRGGNSGNAGTLDGLHLWTAVRYGELNLVWAGTVART